VLQLLGKLWSALAHLGEWFIYGLVVALNKLILAVGVLLTTIIGLFPSFPDAPTTPAAPWVGWLNWFMPIAGLMTGALLFAGLWTAVIAFRVAARWVKAL
jgi:hypothetical protein